MFVVPPPRMLVERVQFALWEQSAVYIIVCLQDAFPARIKGLHIVNEPSIFGTVFAVVKPFLKEKTVKRVCYNLCVSRLLLLFYVAGSYFNDIAVLTCVCNVITS